MSSSSSTFLYLVVIVEKIILPIDVDILWWLIHFIACFDSKSTHFKLKGPESCYKSNLTMHLLIWLEEYLCSGVGAHKWSPEQCCCQSLGPPRARQDHRERPIGRAGQEYWSLASSNWDGKGFGKIIFPFVLHFYLIVTDIWAIGNIYKKILHTEGKVSECCNTSIEEVNMMLITRGVVL